jgi:parallel beta-helix repeat protein
MNDISMSTIRGVHLVGQTDVEVMDNLIVNGSGDGIVLDSSSTTRIYHNNIFGNAGYQVTSDISVELSYGNEGNYWGRNCPDVLFIAGTDSNTEDVVDSYPFGIQDDWDNQGAPWLRSSTSWQNHWHSDGWY